MSGQRVVLGLGSNIGDRVAALQSAVNILASYIAIEGISPIYESAPAYVTDQPPFLNAALVGTTRLEPLPLLWTVRDIESEIGRMPVFLHGPRVIDIDIIFHGDTVMQTPELTVPHRLAATRDFVLRPLADIAPGLKHPTNGRTVGDMLALLGDTGMKPMGSLLTFPPA